jgi:isoquinoline 1-oxidoreductase alpha subunit
MVTLNVNGVRREVQAPDDTPLLYVLRNDLELIGPQFGCGLAQCGACAVLVNGKEARSCVTPVASVANQEITTLEGLPARWAKQKGISAEQAKGILHPVQQAWIEEQTPQCGFCQNGMMIKATELLESNSNPTVAQIKDAFTNSGQSPNLCRCGTYIAILEAVQHAATIMAKRS